MSDRVSSDRASVALVGCCLYRQKATSEHPRSGCGLTSTDVPLHRRARTPAQVRDGPPWRSERRPGAFPRGGATPSGRRCRSRERGGPTNRDLKQEADRTAGYRALRVHGRGVRPPPTRAHRSPERRCRKGKRSGLATQRIEHPIVVPGIRVRRTRRFQPQGCGHGAAEGHVGGRCGQVKVSVERHIRPLFV